VWCAGSDFVTGHFCKPFVVFTGVSVSSENDFVVDVDWLTTCHACIYQCLSLHLCYSAPIGQRSIVTSVSVCVCLSAIIFSELHVRSSPNILCMLCLAMTRPSSGGSDTLCTSSFMDDVMFAHKLRLLDVAAQLKRSAHAASGLAINCAQ